MTKWRPLHAVVLEDQSYLALWSRFGWGNLFLSSGRTEKKLWNFQNAQTVSLQNFCYIVEGEVCCSTVQLHNVYKHSTCSTSYFKLFSGAADTLLQAAFIFDFFPFLITSNTIRESTEVNSKTKQNSAKYIKYYKYEQRNQHRAKENPTLGPPGYKQHSGLFKYCLG